MAYFRFKCDIATTTIKTNTQKEYFILMNELEVKLKEEYFKIVS